MFRRSSLLARVAVAGPSSPPLCPFCASPSHPDQAVLGLELLGCGHVVVDEPEAGGLAATELRRVCGEAVLEKRGGNGGEGCPGSTP